MVNLDKWEEINYEAIRKGDKLMKVVQHEDGTTATCTGVASQESVNGWASKGKWSLVQIYPPFPHKIYRRKAKPFILPTGLGAVVQATRVSTGTLETFMLADPGDGSASWVNEGGGSWFMAKDLLDPRYRDPVVIFKGIHA